MRRLRGGPILAAIVLGVLAGAAPAAAASPAPAGSPAPAPGVWVTGTIALAADCVVPPATSEAGVVQIRGYRCEPQTWTMSDPRLSGTAVTGWNADTYTTSTGLVTVSAGYYEVTNDGGSWMCAYADGLARGMGLLPTPVNDETVTCTGSGGYSGLSAILVSDWTSSSPVKVQGILLTGPLPPAP